MGLVINKQLPLLLNDIIMEFKYIDEIPLYKGGPIATDTLFYLHTLADIPGAISICKGLYLNGDFEEIKDTYYKEIRLANISVSSWAIPGGKVNS